MITRFSATGRHALDCAIGEARRRGAHRLGSEHLLLGLLADPTSPDVAALGVDLAAARAALDAMDSEALATVGVVTGPSDEPEPADPRRPRSRHLPFTGAARAALERCMAEAASRGARRLEPVHLLLALLRAQPPDAAAELLHRLDVDGEAVRRRLDAAA